MLNDVWLSTILSRLQLAYSGRFPPRGIDAAAFRQEWGRELSGLDADQIKHAMANLPPDNPPNVLQFRALCLSRPKPVTRPEPQPKKVTAAPEVTQKLRAVHTEKSKTVNAMGAAVDPRGWARKLKAREEKGEDLSRLQREAWREALNREITAQLIESEES